jgi:CSLREA domain-containing protein
VSRLAFLVIALLTAATGLSLTGTAVAAVPSPPATVNVNTTEDEFDAVPDGQCSLREAIESGNQKTDFGGCTHTGTYAYGTGIRVPGGTYRLTLHGAGDGAGSLNMHTTQWIRNEGIEPAIIDGDGADTVIEEDGNGRAGIFGLTIRGGNTPGIGGGIRSTNTGGIDISDTTITGNVARSGGGIGIADVALLKLTNVTISGNEARDDGGGIYMDGAGSWMIVDRTTATGNIADVDADGTGDGGGMYRSQGDLFVANTILAGNADATHSGSTAPDCSGSFDSGGFNMVGQIGGCGYATGPGDLVGLDPAMGPLAYNGGPTPTHALLPTSPAIDVGNVETVVRPRPSYADQRGVPISGRPDIGAYERVLCAGVTVNRIGTGGKDHLVGTSGQDGFLDPYGADTMIGFAGGDGFCSGIGRDLIKGGKGNDRLLGEFGNDKLIGGRGRDKLRGGPGNDKLIGGPGKDRLHGGLGDDRLKR